MIEQLDINNYRSCIKTSVALQPDLTVLIGPNSGGKTTVLKAYQLLRKLAIQEARARPTYDGGEIDTSRIRVRFNIGDRAATLNATLQLGPDEANNDVLMSARQMWYAKDFTGESIRFSAPLWAASYLGDSDDRRVYIRGWHLLTEDPKARLPVEFVDPLLAVYNFVMGIKYHSATQFTNPANCPASIEIDKPSGIRRSRPSGGHALFIHDMYVASRASNRAAYDQFLEMIGPNGLDLVKRLRFKEYPASAVDVRVVSGGKIKERKRERILVVPQFTIGRSDLSPAQLSEGTFKTISFLFYLMTESSTALLIEEPEVCVHHGLLASVIELIKTYSSQKQIVMSTHSDFVLDRVDPRNVSLVRRDDEGGTTVVQVEKSMATDDYAALRTYLNSEGNLGEYWRHGGLG